MNIESLVVWVATHKNEFFMAGTMPLGLWALFAFGMMLTGRKIRRERFVAIWTLLSFQSVLLVMAPYVFAEIIGKVVAK